MIENHLERLTEIKGIGRKRIKQISQAWEQQKAIKEVMVFLQGHGISTVYATKIYKEYEGEAIEIVTNNPYKLAEDIYGIGFLSADKIARSVGISPWSTWRYRAAILHILTQATADGHCFLPENELVEQGVKLLTGNGHESQPEPILRLIVPEGRGQRAARTRALAVSVESAKCGLGVSPSGATLQESEVRKRDGRRNTVKPMLHSRMCSGSVFI